MILENPSFGNNPKYFGKGRSDRPSRDGERKSFGFKGKKSFFKKNKFKTNWLYK